MATHSLHMPGWSAKKIPVSLEDGVDLAAKEVAEYPKRAALFRKVGWPGCLHEAGQAWRMTTSDFDWINRVLQALESAAAFSGVTTVNFDSLVFSSATVTGSAKPLLKAGDPAIVGKPQSAFFAKMAGIVRILALTSCGRRILKASALSERPILISACGLEGGTSSGFSPGFATRLVPRMCVIYVPQTAYDTTVAPIEMASVNDGLQKFSFENIFCPVSVAVGHEIIHALNHSFAPDIPEGNSFNAIPLFRAADRFWGAESERSFRLHSMQYKTLSEYACVTGKYVNQQKVLPWSENAIRIGIGLPMRQSYPNCDEIVADLGRTTRQKPIFANLEFGKNWMADYRHAEDSQYSSNDTPAESVVVSVTGG
jgi:hypothetical protein